MPFLRDDDGLLDELRDEVEDVLDRGAERRITEVSELEAMIHDAIGAFVHQRLRRRPMVLPVIVEI